MGVDQVIRRCIPEWDQEDILIHCHSLACGGHFGPKKTARKVLGSGFNWPDPRKDSYEFCRRCNRCQLTGGMDFMGPFPSSYGNSYILVTVDYVSKWLEVKATVTCEAQEVSKVLKSNIFCMYGIPKAIISNQGTHFCNRTIEALMKKFGVNHRLSTPYHPQSNGQAEISNREIKSILEKTVSPSRKD